MSDVSYEKIEKQVLEAAQRLWVDPVLLPKDPKVKDKGSIYRLLLISKSFDAEDTQSEDFILHVRDKLAELGALRNESEIFVVISPVAMAEYQRKTDQDRAAQSLPDAADLDIGASAP